MLQSVRSRFARNLGNKRLREWKVKRQQLRMDEYRLINKNKLLIKSGKKSGHSQTRVGESRDSQDFQRRRNCTTMYAANSIFLLLSTSILH